VKSSTVKLVVEMVTQEYARRFAIQAVEATNAHTIVGRLRDKTKVDRDTLIGLSDLADSGGRLVGSVKLRPGYLNSVLVHVNTR
jgi:hypothetical protein